MHTLRLTAASGVLARCTDAFGFGVLRRAEVVTHCART